MSPRLAGGPVATMSTPRLRVRGSDSNKNSRLRDNEEEEPTLWPTAVQCTDVDTVDQRVLRQSRARH